MGSKLRGVRSWSTQPRRVALCCAFFLWAYVHVMYVQRTLPVLRFARRDVRRQSRDPVQRLSTRTGVCSSGTRGYLPLLVVLVRICAVALYTIIPGPFLIRRRYGTQSWRCIVQGASQRPANVLHAQARQFLGIAVSVEI